jgi:alpha-galactosidase
VLRLEIAQRDMNSSLVTFEEMVHACSFNTLACDHSYWSSNVDPTMGRCFTFNLNNSLMTERAGPFYGLRLMLSTNSSEYLAIQTAAGISVLIHDQVSLPSF